MAFCINKHKINKNKQIIIILNLNLTFVFKLLFEYVDTDKENAYTKVKWANLTFITASAKY